MAKVITFSRYFPSYHPKAGEPTFFTEKIWKSLIQQKLVSALYTSHIAETKKKLGQLVLPQFDLIEAKHLTIRAGNRWKVGDKFSPRVWSGKPYNSKQRVIAPDLEIKKVWSFEIKNEFDKDGWYNFFYVNGKMVLYTTEQNPLQLSYRNLATNDGLTDEDLVNWFKANDGYYSGKTYKTQFSGQIICWNENINY